VFADHIALIGPDDPFSGATLLDAGHAGIPINLGAPGACALGERLGQIGRLDVAIVRMLDGAEHALDIAQRPDLLELGRCQEAYVDADRGGDAGVVFEFVEAILRARQPDVGDLAEADILAGLGLQRFVELDRVLVQLAV